MYTTRRSYVFGHSDLATIKTEDGTSCNSRSEYSSYNDRKVTDTYIRQTTLMSRDLYDNYHESCSFSRNTASKIPHQNNTLRWRVATCACLEDLWVDGRGTWTAAILIWILRRWFWFKRVRICVKHTKESQGQSEFE